MERSTPARKPHASTADLLTWPEVPPPDPPSTGRQHQPSDGVRRVVFGGQMTEEEAESVLKRKPCSGPKLKEMTGSGIFTADSEEGEAESGHSFSARNQQTGSRINQQQIKTTSQISFTSDETVTPKKPTSLAEVAKQRELSGTLQSEFEAKVKKQSSTAKSKEISGHDIFAPPETTPRPLAARSSEINVRDVAESNPRSFQTSAELSKPEKGSSNYLFGEESVTKTAKKIYSQRVTELAGNDIFKGDAPPGSAEKSMSSAKLKEMSGNDIFADGKAPSRDYYGGIRKPPGGESSIALV